MKCFLNEMIENVKDYKVKCMVKKIFRILLWGNIILLLILGCFMFAPGVKNGILDRDTMITMTATIMSGFLGVTGALIGVMGTYGAFYLGVEKEREEKQNYKQLMLFSLLNYTIKNTYELYDGLNTYYKKSIRDAIGEGVYLKDILSPYADEIKNDIDEDAVAIYRAVMDYEEIKILNSSMGVYFNEILLGKINLNALVYDKDWSSYLECILQLRNDDVNDDIQRITKWLILIQNYSSNDNIDVLEFILLRRGIRKTIEDLCPEIK